MAAVWMRTRSDLRSRWRGAVVIALLMGLASGIAMTAASGARRTASSYDRLLASSKGYEVEVQLTGDAGPDPRGALLDRVAALPQVVAHGRIAFVPSSQATPGEPREPFAWDVSSVAMGDRDMGRTIEVPTLLSGRLPNVDDPREGMASPEFLRNYRLTVGDDFTLQLATFDDLLKLFRGAPEPPTGPTATVRIVGSWRIPHDVSIQEERGLLFLTPAFYRQNLERIATLPSLVVRLRNGARDVSAFVDGVRALGREDVLSVETQESLLAKVDRALGVQSTGLWALAAAVAVGAALVLGQAFGRWLMASSEDLETLEALGMGRGSLTASPSLTAVAFGIAAAVAAVVVAIALTPLVPVGFAREIDPDIGFFADAPVLLAGGAAILSVVVLRGWIQALVATRRLRRAPPERTRPNTLADRIARAGLSPALVTGVRFAVEPGRGRTALPVRSVIAGTVLSIVAVTGAFVFGRSMEHMLDTPRTYGWNWDLVAFGGEDPDTIAEIERRLADSASVASFSRASIKTTTFGNQDLETLAVTPIKGTVLPVMLEGRYPAADDEIALATKTIRSSGRRIDDRITLPGSEEACPGGSDCRVDFRIVGRVIFWGEGSDPDRGAVLTEAGQARIRTSEGFTDYLVRTSFGSGPTSSTRIERFSGDTAPPTLPVNIKNVTRARSMPTILAGILGALALATIVHALVTAARRRRRDLAVLKTLGFVRRQVRATVVWHSVTTVLLSLVVGVPLGVVTGRWAWLLLADRLGVQPVAAAPVVWMLAGTAAVIVLAGVVALGPARIAARTRPAEILRTE